MKICQRRIAVRLERMNTIRYYSPSSLQVTRCWTQPPTNSSDDSNTEVTETESEVYREDQEEHENEDQEIIDKELSIAQVIADESRIHINIVKEVIVRFRLLQDIRMYKDVYKL